MTQRVTSVVFDLGGVLIDWDPNYLYRKLIPDDAERHAFLTEVFTQSWTAKQDAGRSVAEGEAELIARFPERKALIEAGTLRYPETLKGPIDDSVNLLWGLHDAQVPLYALTNWSAETFPVALKRFDFLQLFRDIVVSGTEKVIKPDPRIYEILLSRDDLDPEQTLFIDDKSANVDAARKLGFHGHHFTSPKNLETELIRLDLPLLERKPQ
jgi:2-haloacid dehalogenase